MPLCLLPQQQAISSCASNRASLRARALKHARRRNLDMFEGIRAFFGARIGSRWSLYFVHKRDGLRYTLQDDAVDVLLGYVLAHVKKGKRISPDWELHLNFNFEHKSIRLVEAFFSKGGVSQTLFDLIAAIDSDWMVPRGELVFVDARTRKQLPLGTSDQTFWDQTPRMTTMKARIENRLDDDKDAHVTLASVLSEVIR
jgi:hypothetical protein